LSTLRIDIVDAGGSRVLSDNGTQVTANGVSGSDVCGFTTGGFSRTAPVSNGRLELAVRSTTTPGSCTVSIVTNSQSIAGTSATLTTQIVGPANQLAVVSSESPKPASAPGGACTVLGPNTDPSCTRVVVEVRDFNGARLTGDSSHPIAATPDAASCGTATAVPVTQAAFTGEVAGRATFAFRSQGSYAACVITFSSSGLSGTNGSFTWTGGGADHLACTLLPVSIANDGASQANGEVTARDASNNIVTGSNFTVIFSRTAGNSTVLVGSNQQTMVNGFANFTVRSTQTAGSDTYIPSMGFGGPALPHQPTPCQVTVHP
jgi:hypothetical protein